MTSNDVFKKLAEKFDDGQIVGAPMAPSLLKILIHRRSILALIRAA